jgi:hypothetical protein
MPGAQQIPFAKTPQSTVKKAGKMSKTKARTLKLSC